jgi:mannose-6-phosphate isomerase class I
MPVRISPYDLAPSIAVPGDARTVSVGWPAIAQTLRDAIARLARPKTVLVVECYAGVDEAAVLSGLARAIKPVLTIAPSEALLPPTRINALVAPLLGDDPVFGRFGDLTLDRFFDAEKLDRLRARLRATADGLVLIVGCGARLVSEGHIFVYADLARWEIQQRQRRQEIGNLGANNRASSAAAKYKRAFFVDWRVCDRWKQTLIEHWDFALDTHHPDAPKLACGEAVRRGLAETAGRPFRVVPFFDPAPWGGQWLRDKFELDEHAPNFGWGFDCVPEENSLLLDFDGIHFELPALNAVFTQAPKLLGEPVYRRFGDAFPIRFDLLDTMGGGNLSLQVHPLVEYARRTFGLTYTQDESYYILESSEGASVYLGFHDGVDAAAFERELRTAARGGSPVAVERFVQSWPARPHDHFLIPAGTIHCAGAGNLVLEISATPYLFTFKLWDWDRLGLDGLPRPIHLDRGLTNLQWDRTTRWTRANLVNQQAPAAAGPGWREERTGLHALQFIETRRHWFTGLVQHDTGGLEHGSVNVLNLVQGQEAVVESPGGMFEPFVVHYAETFIVPAAVGSYTVRPHGASVGRECATIKASVRPTP